MIGAVASGNNSLERCARQVEKAGRKPECATFIEPGLSFAGCLAVLFVDIVAINETRPEHAEIFGGNKDQFIGLLRPPDPRCDKRSKARGNGCQQVSSAHYNLPCLGVAVTQAPAIVG